MIFFYHFSQKSHFPKVDLTNCEVEMIQNFETVLFKIKRRDGKEFQNDVSTISLKIADEFANSWINAFDSFGIIRDRDSDNAGRPRAPRYKNNSLYEEVLIFSTF